MQTQRQQLAYLFATGFGSGRLPKSPGTWGSLACLLAWLIVAKLGVELSLLTRIALPTLFFIVGTWASEIVLRAEEAHSTPSSLNSKKSHRDPQFIVIDEWVGMLVALIPASGHNYLDALIALALFRFFDITKLGPIGMAEKLPRAWGIMADDLVAGLFSACLGYAIMGRI